MSDNAAKSNGWRLSENPRRGGIAASPRRTPASVLVRKHKASKYAGGVLQGLWVALVDHARDGKFARTPELSQARDRAGRARPDHRFRPRALGVCWPPTWEGRS